MARDVLPIAELPEADAVYMEGGWNRADGSPDRFPQELALEFVRRGGQLIVADVDRQVAKDTASVLENSRTLLGTVPSPDERGVQYLYDAEARDFGNALRFLPSRMRIDDALEPAWDGIDSVLVSGSIVLAPGGGVVASGHASTSILVNDLSVATAGHWPWATMKGHGLGHVIIGQTDDRTIVGLEMDFKSLGKGANRDGFEQALVHNVANTMWPRWETVGLSLNWVEKDVSRWLSFTCPDVQPLFTYPLNLGPR